MTKLKKSLFFALGIILFSCNDPNIIGLEIQDPSDKIIINNDSIHNFSIITISEDSLRSDEPLNLMLGKIQDPIFGDNTGSFITQILLPSNNIESIENVVIDSVFLTYAYTGYYGDLDENNNFDVSVYELDMNIFKDSIYYSNFNPDYISENLSVEESFINGDSIEPLLKIQLKNEFGEKIINQTGTSNMIDNNSFLEFLNGLYIDANATNTIMYLNSESDKSKLSVYYHHPGIDTALSLDFIVGGESARINIFNQKDSSTLNVSPASNQTYLQSMAGHKAKLIFNNIQSLQDIFINKSINRVTVDLELIEDANYDPHEKLYLVRENIEGNIVFLTDFTIEGESHFGGELNNSKYSFNITRYFFQLINNPEYTDTLYILSSGAAANANRTILDNSKLSINVIYSEI